MRLRYRDSVQMSQSKSKRIRVRIMNPLLGQQQYCTLERAWRYIRHQTAEWVDQTRGLLRIVTPPKPALAVGPGTFNPQHEKTSDSGFNCARYPTFPEDAFKDRYSVVRI